MLKLPAPPPFLDLLVCYVFRLFVFVDIVLTLTDAVDFVFLAIDCNDSRIEQCCHHSDWLMQVHRDLCIWHSLVVSVPALTALNTVPLL